MFSSRLVTSFLFVLLALATLGATAGDTGPPSLLLVFDASGSMWGQIEGENKIVIARRVLGGLVDGLRDDSEVGLIAYGHRREGDCDDVETLVPIGPLRKAPLKQTVDAVNPKGKTPITKSLRRAFDSLDGRDGATTVILISDGLETCGGDPCATVRMAKEKGHEFVLHVVGFDVAGEDVSSLECAAQAGGGLFFSAENAAELSSAIETAAAMPAETFAGRLSVEVVANGKLQDASVHVRRAGGGEEMGVGRTYTAAGTNPRLIPLPDGRFDAQVTAVGIEGDVTRRFAIEIVEGSTVEKTIDYSTGEVSVGVTRNGERSDAVYRLTVPETGKQAAQGRTYTSQKSNPARVRITAGTYEVSVGSVEISGRPWVSLGEVRLEPGGNAAVSHDFASGTLSIGVERSGRLVDATVSVAGAASGKEVARGRTYTRADSNPSSFILPPGDYRVRIGEIRGEKREIAIAVKRGETAAIEVDLDE